MEQASEPESNMTEILECSDWECKTPMVNIGGSLIAQLVKNPTAIQETPVQFLGWEDPKGNSKQGEKTTFRMGENNSK